MFTKFTLPFLRTFSKKKLWLFGEVYFLFSQNILSSQKKMPNNELMERKIKSMWNNSVSGSQMNKSGMSLKFGVQQADVKVEKYLDNKD